MSPKIILIVLLLASASLAAIADDSASTGSDVTAGKRIDNRPQNSKPDSSYIRRSKEDRDGAYKKHVKNRGKDKNGQGGRNPSPDA